MKIFISYSSKDEAHLSILLGHLKSAGLDNLDPLSDGRLEPGDLWEDELRRYMDQADAGILLLSSSFLQSQWCQKELDYLWSKPRPFRLLPVLVEKCFWRKVRALSQLQLVNSAAPISAASNLEDGWYDVAMKIQEVLANMRTTSDLQNRGDHLRQGSEARWENITKAIRKGVFTPVLGPGCYDVTEKTTEAKDHVRDRLNRILESIGSDAGARDYAEGVVASGLSAAVDHSLIEKRPDPAWIGLLVELQAELARLGAHCCSLMGSAMQRHPRGFTDVHEMVVDLDEEVAPSVRATLRSSFFKAARSAKRLNQFFEKLPSKERQSIEGLGIYGIRSQLFSFTYSIFYPEVSRRSDQEAEEWKQDNIDFVAAAERLVRPADNQKFPRLALVQVEWIGDLLWQTIRFDAPMYPSSDELAFQLSVCLNGPPRKERVGTVVELVGKEDRPDLLGKLFKAYEGSSAKRRKDVLEFYETIARSLFYHARSGSPAQGRIMKGSGAEAASRKRVTIAISTNFDRELERALSDFHRTYHVLFPVYARDGEEAGEQIEEAWLLRTFRFDDEEKEHWDDAMMIKSSNSLKGFSFEGPLVVKLYGSPRETLNKTAYAHRVSISDCDFIEAMVSRERYWPPDLKDLLVQGGRVLCFLGYPLSDPNSRLRLSDHLDREQRSGTLYLIDYPEDPLRHTLLEHINVKLVPTTIEEFLASLKSFFNRFPEAD